MKKTLFLLAFLASANFLTGQDLLSDLMAVETVTIVDSEETKESSEKFTKTLGEQQAKVDKLLGKHTEKFQNEVKALISKYNKVLAKGIESDVNIEKARVATEVNALSMTLLKDKKRVLTDFNNFMVQEIRKLPKTLKSESDKQVEEFMDTYKETFEAELAQNKAVIKTFKNTVHLTRNESAPSTPAASQADTEEEEEEVPEQ